MQRLRGKRKHGGLVAALLWLALLAAAPPSVPSFFLGEVKAVLSGCEDHWTLQRHGAVPRLFRMTGCVDVRVVVPGSWVAFSYGPAHAPKPQLGLEGDRGALYGWLLGVRHRFPVSLAPARWHRVCLRRDGPNRSFSLELDGRTVAQRTVIAGAIPAAGRLRLGCGPLRRPPAGPPGEVELYMFRTWADLDRHGPCQRGAVIDWRARSWGVSSPKARQRDPTLPCVEHRRLRRDLPANAHTGMKAWTSPAQPRLRTQHQPTLSQVFPWSGGAKSKHRQTPQSENPSGRHVTSLHPAIGAVVSGAARQQSWSPLLSEVDTPASQAQPSGATAVKCDISRLCSAHDAYFWMAVSVAVTQGAQSERVQRVRDLVRD